MTQDEFALLCDVHRTTIGLLERAERIPGIDVLVRLAGALEMTPNDLLEGLSWEPDRGGEPLGAYNIGGDAVSCESPPARAA